MKDELQMVVFLLVEAIKTFPSRTNEMEDENDIDDSDLRQPHSEVCATRIVQTHTASAKSNTPKEETSHQSASSTLATTYLEILESLTLVMQLNSFHLTLLPSQTMIPIA